MLLSFLHVTVAASKSYGENLLYNFAHEWGAFSGAGSVGTATERELEAIGCWPYVKSSLIIPY
jgi:hypothetical protein